MISNFFKKSINPVRIFPANYDPLLATRAQVIYHKTSIYRARRISSNDFKIGISTGFPVYHDLCINFSPLPPRSSGYTQIAQSGCTMFFEWSGPAKEMPGNAIREDTPNTLIHYNSTVNDRMILNLVDREFLKFVSFGIDPDCRPKENYKGVKIWRYIKDIIRYNNEVKIYNDSLSEIRENLEKFVNIIVFSDIEQKEEAEELALLERWLPDFMKG